MATQLKRSHILFQFYMSHVLKLRAFKAIWVN